MTPAQEKIWQAMLAQSFEPRQWYEERDDAEEHTTISGGMKMWVYRRAEDMWEVGYYNPQGEWQSDSFHPTKTDAAQRVRWLNGGGT